VVGAIREIEFMNMVRKKFNPDFVHYLLSDMVPSCGKVNYKTHYQPGYVLCPRTKNKIPYHAAKDMISMFSSMPSYEKRDLPYLMLDDVGDQPTNDEEIYMMIVEYE
jgi:hypothetical protein